ncbi:MAG: hypothetical protein WC804_12100 [Sphingomonas sp.]|jgi:hypothetical protein|uniref:hypothetical protein n=1 Tax=Sphingomonas sp. TaxID=28214 RepID=UPI00356190E0
MQGEDNRLHWWQTRWFVLLCMALAVVPLLYPTIPPLVDLPGHIGRYRVQLAMADNPWLANWYDFQWSLIGNLGIDLLVIPLAKIFGLELAVKLIVMTIPPLIVSGLLWIAREVHGRIPATALFALPLAYCYPIHFGFVNFALSMGIALNLFALWLRLARTGHLTLRAVIFVPLSCLLWLCHTFGWGVLGVLAFSAEMIRQHDAGKRWFNAWVRAGLGCVPLAIPMALMVLWRTGDHVTGQTADWFDWQAKTMWVTMMLRDRWALLDIASTAVLLLILFKGFRDPAIEYSRNLGLSALFLLTVYILLPRIVFGSAYADMRLAPFMVAIAVIALRPRPGLSIRHASTLAALGMAFFLVRVVSTTASFVLYSKSYDRAFAVIDRVPRGAKMVTFVGRTCRDDWAYSRLEHIPGIALERKLIFANDQWSMAGAQTLTTHYPIARRFAHDPSQIVTDRWCHGEWWWTIQASLTRLPRDAFDYVWMINPPPYDAKFNAGLVEIYRDGPMVLYRIDHSKAGPVVPDSEILPPRRRRPAPAPTPIPAVRRP